MAGNLALRTSHCIKLRYEKKGRRDKLGTFKDLTGQRFGRLVVVGGGEGLDGEKKRICRPYGTEI